MLILLILTILVSIFSIILFANYGLPYLMNWWLFNNSASKDIDDIIKLLKDGH